MTRWHQFDRYCIKVTPILEAISRNGLGIDPVAQAAFFKRLEAERDGYYEAIQAKVPLHVFRIKSWKRSPKLVDADSMATITIGHKKEEKLTAKVKLIAYPEGGFWARLPFNPRSWEQVQDLAAAVGAKLPKKRDAEDDDDVSTESKHLKKAAKKHPVFDDILKYRQLDKLLTSYQWQLDANNRVHPAFGFHPSTWRKSCRQPNIQTIPKRSDLAKQFRKMIVPRQGNVLIEGDSAAIEAVIVGHLAGSERYIRLARAGVHGWLTSALHGKPISLDISNSALTAACQSAKKEWPDDYEKCKRVVHLCLTSDHEVLTPQGWKRLDQVTIADQVAQWDEGRITFVGPQAKHREFYDGTMIHFEGQAISQIVTSEHGMPVSIDHSFRVNKVPACKVGNSAFLPLTGEYWIGDLSPYPVQIALAVAIQADGSIVGQTVRFKLKRERKIERLLTLLDSHEYPHKVKRYSDCTVIKFPLSLLGDAVDLLNIKKEFTWDTLRLSTLSREIFLGELPYWDGSYTESFRHKRVQYNTKIKRNAEIVQTLAHLSGRQGLLRSTIVGGREYWLVSLNKRQFAYMRPVKRTETPVKQLIVHNLTVPSGYFLVRHFGKISITGNSNYCGTARRICEEYPDEFPKEADAATLQNFYFSTDAGKEIKAWQQKTVEVAHANKGLENHFGLRHRFFSLYSYDSRRKVYVLGDDAKRAVAFVPQSDASFVQSDILLRLVQRDVRFMDWIVAIIHDSIVLDLPAAEADQAAAVLYEEMTRPLEQLGNLWIGAEVKRGANLCDMTAIKF